jgi:hypothetical protein
MRRYTWRESAEIISPPIFAAKWAATGVLPDAVGPNIVIIFFICYTYILYISARGETTLQVVNRQFGNIPSSVIR